MIVTAWDEYRAWAARARELQKSSQYWNTAALVSAAGAALFGAGAIQTTAYPLITKLLSLAAAVTAGAVPILGKEILMAGAEAKWIRVRATAETIKSECYRYAARAGSYSGANPDQLFEARCIALSAAATAEGLLDKKDPVDSSGDKRRPGDHFDVAWYDTYRIQDQIEFYDKRQRDHESAANRLRWLAFGSSAVAALFGLAGVAYQPMFAPWVGAMTTIATAITAQGLMGRHQQLAASHSAMSDGLRRIRNWIGKIELSDLVTRTEDLLQSEHAAWVEHMTRSIPGPPAIPANKDDSKQPGS